MTRPVTPCMYQYFPHNVPIFFGRFDHHVPIFLIFSNKQILQNLSMFNMYYIYKYKSQINLHTNSYIVGTSLLKLGTGFDQRRAHQPRRDGEHKTSTPQGRRTQDILPAGTVNTTYRPRRDGEHNSSAPQGQ